MNNFFASVNFKPKRRKTIPAFSEPQLYSNKIKFQRVAASRFVLATCDANRPK